ncbi:MAG: hypothetical protein KAT68_04170 [Bacteroidales bacterium]|nr:hypothetical protein [Bacteroidales bacterium]
MKTKFVIFSFFFVLITLFVQAQSEDVKFIELSENQLKSIGFEIDQNGIFFRSVIPNDGYRDEKTEYIKEIGFFNGKDNFGTSMGRGGYTKDIQFPGGSESCKYYNGITPINADYYIIRVVDLSGKENFSFHLKDVKVLPVLIKQSNYKFNDQRDILVYFKYTDQLKEKLKDIPNLDDYVYNYIKVENE